MHYHHAHLHRQRRAAMPVITRTVTRWHPAARAAVWTMVVMVLTAFVLFGLG